MKLLSTLAFASTLGAVLPEFERRHGVRVEAVLLPTAVLVPRIEAGERGDAALLTQEAVESLAASGVLDPATVRALAVSRVGVAVAAGAPRPPLASAADLVAALERARNVALSRSGASGMYFQGLIDRLGVGAMVRAKAVVIDSGYTAELLRDGRADLAVQQVSELLMVPGIDLIGPLPPGLGAESVFGGAVFTGAADPAAAGALLAAIAEAPDVLRRCGLEPAG